MSISWDAVSSPFFNQDNTRVERKLLPYCELPVFGAHLMHLMALHKHLSDGYPVHDFSHRMSHLPHKMEDKVNRSARFGKI